MGNDVYIEYTFRSIFKHILLRYADILQHSGWYPEVVFLTVVFSNSIFIAVLFQNTTVFETCNTLYLSFSLKH